MPAILSFLFLTHGKACRDENPIARVSTGENWKPQTNLACHVEAAVPLQDGMYIHQHFIRTNEKLNTRVPVRIGEPGQAQM